MYYDKRIRYLSYYESGIKLQNAGYVKFQVRDSLCQMVIQVKGPRLMGSGETSVYLLSGMRDGAGGGGFYAQPGTGEGYRSGGTQKHLLGNLTIHNGQGYCAVRMDAGNMADSGLRYDEICGIRIELREYQYLESRWSAVNTMRNCAVMPVAPPHICSEMESIMPEESKPQEISLIVTPVSERSRCVSDVDTGDERSVSGLWQENRASEASKEKELKVPVIDNPGKGIRFEERASEMLNNSGKGIGFEGYVPEENIAEKQPVEAPEIFDKEPEAEASDSDFLDRATEERLAEMLRENLFPENDLRADKWEQLRRTYPIVHPIREDEEYLKVEPKDFVIFTEKYQELVHNSFLLHGYYNYRHLIFGKKERDGRAAYYLGVPGTFHDREKTVAVMFGFEAFDGKREPAENGDFGYYLKRVEI